ncbi:JAB domain-containing protein [Kordia sp.]|uniref:JAB domain-containing protein n=1 Tax=Kordia sp. TaxID=1965332 RepID=UPI003D282E9C
MKLNSLPSTVVLSSAIVGVVYKRQAFNNMFTIKKSKDASDYLRSVIDADTLDLQEHFWAIYLTNANRVLAFAEIAKGGVTSVTVDKKNIFQLALLVNATAIIVAHNHPSGTLKVSGADKAITKKLCSAGEIMDIKVLDHIIITSEDYVSLADENLM